MIIKNIITAILLIFSVAVFSQKSKQHLDNGIAKHEKQDFKGAIKDYTKAIKSDKGNVDAYFNRGTCELALNDLEAAMNDFTKAIELEPQLARAYYSRATVYLKNQKYKESLPDLDKTIELASTTPNALTLRGQIRALTGNINEACEDFTRAKEIGDSQAQNYINQFCEDQQPISESLVLDWPEEENWEIVSSQENEKMTMVELINANETPENWTEIGTMISVKGSRKIPVDKAMNVMFEQTKQVSPEAKLTFIEKNETAEYPWIIFTIESTSFKNDETPESQLWFIIQGKTALYTNSRAVKRAELSSELKEKWIAFFKAGKIVTK